METRCRPGRRGIRKQEMTGDKGRDDNGMRRRTQKTEVLKITNVAHAVGTASAACTSVCAAISGYIATKSFEEERRFRGKVHGARYISRGKIPWVSYYLDESLIFAADTL